MKLSDELIIRLIWLVKTFVKNRNSWKLEIVFFFVKTHSASWAVHFFLKKISFRIFEKKVILFCLHLRLAKVPYGVRTPWYECLINLHHPTIIWSISQCQFLWNFCPICHQKTGHNFQKLSLCISFFYPSIIPIFYYHPYDDILNFFSHMNFFINIELWHFYVIFVTLIWCCVCKINYYF